MVPNININYPLFDFIFKISGFYIIPPIAGILIAPTVVMVCSALFMIGLRKLYNKYFSITMPDKVIVITKDEFVKILEEKERKNHDGD